MNYPIGNLAGDQRHRARLWINYEVPRADGLRLSLLQSLESGVPFTTAAFTGVDPRPYVTNPGYQAFNPFTTPPAEGTNWATGPNDGRALTRFAYTTPRTFRLTFACGSERSLVGRTSRVRLTSRNSAERPSRPQGSDVTSSLEFMAGGGEVGFVMRSLDWSASPLGPPDGWPPSLRTVVGLLLQSRFPMFVAWGKDLGFLYNDPYAEILGTKHPSALGRRFYDIWSEIWPDISPLIEAAMAGHATYREDLPLVMNRKGYNEQTWFTFSYSPVRDESGQLPACFAPVPRRRRKCWPNVPCAKATRRSSAASTRRSPSAS